MIKAGIIGTGFIGPAHIEAIRRLGFVEVVAICGHQASSAKESAQKLNVPYYYDDVDKFLELEGLQVVHNCTPNHLHADINRKILRAGKHVFSEKPLCLSLEDARELVSLADEAGVVHGVSFVYRQFAMVQQAASMMRNHELGRFFSAHGSYLQDWMSWESDFNWRVDAAQGGASRTVADIGSHWCDTLQFVTGKRIVEVMADLAIVWPTRKANLGGSATFAAPQDVTDHQDIPVNTEDMGSVLLRFDDGTKGSFTVSQVSAGRKNRLNFEINGSKSSVAWDQETPQRLWIGYREKANQLLSDDPGLLNADVAGSAHFPGGHHEGWPDAFKNMMLHFYRAVEQGAMPDASRRKFASFHEGANVMAIVDAIVKSHHQQRWVTVTA